MDRSYFTTCAALNYVGAFPLDRYRIPPSIDINYVLLIILGFFAFVGSVLYYLWQVKKHKEAISEWTQLKAKLDGILKENRGMLNIAN